MKRLTNVEVRIALWLYDRGIFGMLRLVFRLFFCGAEYTAKLIRREINKAGTTGRRII